MGVEDGTYRILQARLADRAAELGRRAGKLNSQRQEVFGARGWELTGTARPRTEGEGAACGVVAVRPGVLLLGTTAPDLASGLLSLHAGDGSALEPGAVPGLLDDERFHRDLAELLRYFRDARLAELVRTPAGRLLAVFRTGGNEGDLRAFGWQVTDRRVEYLGNHGERDLPRPADSELDWTTAGREHHDRGRIRIEGAAGAVSVAATGGSLTVHALPGDAPLYQEPVDDPLQSLADAAVAYAVAGPLLVLRVRPYNEHADRYLVVNTRTGTVRRQDSLARGARLLPAEQGLIFPGGYELADGGHRSFRLAEGLRFEDVLVSPDGEDLLYVLRDPAAAQVLLLPWNTVRREAAAALHGAGHTLLPDGTLVLLRPDREPVRTHELQLWDTPFASAEHAAAQAARDDGPLARIGNADLVRGIADCLDVVRTATAAAEQEPAAAAPDLVLDACARASDRHYWLADLGLLEPLAELQAAAEQLAAEQARVRQLAARAAQALEQAAEQAASLVRRSQGEPPADAEGWTALLAQLRRTQGGTRTLREIPRIDLAALESVEQRLADELAAATGRAFAFFAAPDAFAAPLAAARRAAEDAAAAVTATEADRLGERLTEQAEVLTTVTDLVTDAVAADPAAGTAVLLAIGEVLAAVNRARAVLAGRRRELLDAEHRAAHAAESALLAQATAAALAAADSPASCDGQLARLLLRVDGLEARFAEAEALAAALARRREEIQQAFTARRQTLLDEAATRAGRVAASAARALEALRRRLRALSSADDIHAALAADPMAVRVRAAADELRGLDDPVHAQELEDGLLAAVRSALRELRDRTDLSDDGGATVRLGRHRFAVRCEPVELTLQPDGDGLAFVVTGTGYRRRADLSALPALADGRAFWNQPLVSEDPTLYRSEYLAALLLPRAAQEGSDGEALTALVRRAAERAYDEGYERGVHDHDAAAVLGALVRLRARAGLLEHPAPVRAAAQLFWAHATTPAQRAAWQRRARSLTLARAAYGPDAQAPAAAARTALAGELSEAVAEFTADRGLPPTDPAGAYLVDELADPRDGFAVSAAGRTLLDAFRRTEAASVLTADLDALAADLPARRQLAAAWLESYAATREDPDGVPEAVAELCAPALPRYEIAVPVAETVTGLLGSHPRVRDGSLTVRIDELPYRARAFREHRVPAFRAYQRQRTEVLAAERDRLRLDEHRPRPLAGFVRNQLIDRVYLPLVGDSLAKQLGTVDAAATADRSGLLLLLSPPGYGKTTLLEYVADRLGLLMVRVDGPALGSGTRSLDPDRAPDAAARREVEKIVFALEAGSNVLLHLDDIQHLSAELLQKFIPLCDAQRRIEAVSDGTARSYDLRGRRFAVCLAGNPHTADGRRFRIPDMLANRADVWNLGEVLTGHQDLFALSFLENALAAHPVLAPLAGAEPADLRLLVALADGDPGAQADRLGRAVPDLERAVAALARLRQVQRTVLAVNQAYIDSAAQEDRDRGEPPFLLQGSYRTMARLAARIDPVQSEAEVEALLDDFYLAEARGLGSAAEANLLKLALLRGRATPEQAARWRRLCATYAPAAEGQPSSLAPSTAVSSV
ncbi:DNA repair ATPase [Streptacidiphilus monticola]|uniref:DNA repair ATPase n=1 Tax=Streptacidiphilus monticola TaxID=2161674 RepID=A0ABW1FWD4_9ACTN